MAYQITINSTPDITNLCSWHIEEIASINEPIEKIACGEIKPEQSANPVAFIADEIVKLCENESKQQRDLSNLKIRKQESVSVLEFFKLYGLLSAKLNPSTIQISAHGI